MSAEILTIGNWTLRDLGAREGLLAISQNRQGFCSVRVVPYGRIGGGVYIQQGHGQEEQVGGGIIQAEDRVCDSATGRFPAALWDNFSMELATVLH